MKPIRERRFPVERAFLFLFFVVPLLSYSCAFPPSIDPARPARVIPKVPFYPQESYQCGPASLAGVLNYWGFRVTPGEIAAEIFSPDARGTLDMDLVFYAQRKGMKAAQFTGTWEDLRMNVESNHPLIVLVDEGFWVYQKGHFMVVVGYGDESLVVNSGKEEHKFIPRETFLKTWERTKFWTLRIAP